jgi:3',5'-cyclic AMP phosphodiesterase CpdA
MLRVGDHLAIVGCRRSELSLLAGLMVATTLGISYSIAQADTPNSGAASQIHLSWAQEPSSSFTVTWHTAGGDSPAFVEYRDLNSEAWISVPAHTRRSPGDGFLHTATVTGLKETTEYQYRVSNDKGAERPVGPSFQTRTAPQERAASFTFAFISDTGIAGRLDGNASGTQQIIDELVADDPLFVLGGGDYAYANNDPRFSNTGETIDAWFNQMESVFQRSPFMPQYGNHEISLDERYSDWAPRFSLPSGAKVNQSFLYDVRQALEAEVSYSFGVGAVHFTGLFVTDADIAPETVTWLDRDLAAARDRGAEWLIVYQHEPLFAHGYVHPSYKRVRKILAPILEKHNVDLHLSSHDQSYERTLPLRNVSETLEISSTSLNDYAAGDGVMYLKISPSGKMSERQNDFSRFLEPMPEYMAARDDTMHHYALFTVDGTKELRAEIYGVTGDGSQKQVVDAFRIRQQINVRSSARR